MTDFEYARRVMVDTQLRTSAISDRRLLAAFGRVPREKFVPASRQALAYIDDAHQLESTSGRRFLPPATPFARLLNLAAIGSTDRVLDLYCTSGYSTAVLSHIAEAVIGVETDPALAEQAKANLSKLGIENASVVCGPLETAGRAHGPYDVIVVGGALDETPDIYFSQLKDGGRLVAMLQAGPTAVAHLYVKSGKDVASRADFDGALPRVATHSAKAEFVF